MSGADGEDPIVSAFTPGYKRRTKTETEEGIENYSAMLNEMQARMEKMEIKYETQMAEMAMENDTQAKIIHELRTKQDSAKDHEETEKVDTKNTKPKG